MKAWLAPVRFLRDLSGAALAESAIAVPILLVVFAGVFAFGSTFLNTQVLETAARDAARYLAHTNAAAADEAVARNLAVYANTAGAGAPRVAGLRTADIAISYVSLANPIDANTGERAYRGPDPLRVARVDISWRSPAAGMWGLFGASPVTYHAVNQQRVIGD